ncbi:MAG: hypothetical protein NZM11_00265 [Anaerolineales bacterium]|nr:hypothetical protein [Anaerolineales bacterium]
MTQDGKLLTHRTVTWTTGDAKNLSESLAIISNRPAARARLREYARRRHTAEGFRDDKSGGFDMAHTRLQHAERLERLLLALAIAKLWCHELGEHVLAQGEAARRMIDPGPQRELSLFQLGLRWLRRCLSTHIALLPPFLARISPLKHFKAVCYSAS